MGDRVSVSFSNGNEESVVLFSHWGGRGFLNATQEYVESLKLCTNEDKVHDPLDRLEPSTVMVDFIRWLTTETKRVGSNLYLGKTPNDGDNSDNGHWTLDLLSNRWVT